jgi:hypothetical protein
MFHQVPSPTSLSMTKHIQNKKRFTGWHSTEKHNKYQVTSLYFPCDSLNDKNILSSGKNNQVFSVIVRFTMLHFSSSTSIEFLIKDNEMKSVSEWLVLRKGERWYLCCGWWSPWCRIVQSTTCQRWCYERSSSHSTTCTPRPT